MRWIQCAGVSLKFKFCCREEVEQRMPPISHTVVCKNGLSAPASPQGMAWIPGGTFRMGSNDFYPEERPVHRVKVDGFWMDEHPVTNAEFRRFVEATGSSPDSTAERKASSA